MRVRRESRHVTTARSDPTTHSRSINVHKTLTQADKKANQESPETRTNSEGTCLPVAENAQGTERHTVRGLRCAGLPSLQALRPHPFLEPTVHLPPAGHPPLDAPTPSRGQAAPGGAFPGSTALTRSRTCTRAAWLGRASKRAGTLKERVACEAQDRTDRWQFDKQQERGVLGQSDPRAASALWGSGNGVGPPSNGGWGSWGKVLLPLPGPPHTATRMLGRGREGRQARKARGPDGPAGLETLLCVDTHLRPRRSWECHAG